MTSTNDNTAYENAIISELEHLETSAFRVQLQTHHVFVCGGLIDATNTIPPSFRDRFFSYTVDHFPVLHDSIVLAEIFKDYFKENAYPDLFVFESEIASISSLVIIFLESPGSFVELGMFCAISRLQEKLLIVAPREETEGEDSFIFLGPLEYLKRRVKNSVVIYPWPSPENQYYDTDHLDDICLSIEEKLALLPKTTKFDENEFGHLAFLIAEIIRVCYPLTLTEIEVGLLALQLDSKESVVHRAVYLLEKLSLIARYSYSGYEYFYSLKPGHALMNFSGGKKFNINTVKMALKKAYVLEDDSSSKKRRTALKEINKILEFKE